MTWYPTPPDLPTGPMFPEAETQAARERVAFKRAIRRGVRDMIDLRYGAVASLPNSATTAWGARLIYPDDVVWDRVDADGPRKAELLDHLNSAVKDAPWKRAKELADRGAMSPRDTLDWVLYEDEKVRVIGNPQRSHGYLYVVAYFRDESM